MQGKETEEEVKNKGGRPTKYTPELLEKARDYLHTYETIYDQAFPSDIGLARVIGITTSTLYEWAKDPEKKEFSDILDEINADQQLVAWRKGLKGEYNASLVKLLLGKHGYSDKSENEHKGEIKTGIADSDREILNRFLAQTKKD